MRRWIKIFFFFKKKKKNLGWSLKPFFIQTKSDEVILVLGEYKIILMKIKLTK